MRFRRRKPRRTNSANRRRLFARHQRLGFEVLESRQLLAVDIMATKVDSPDNNPVLPGDNIRYTVDIQNNGDTDATNVVFSDTIDGNTTLVGGSVNVTPIAFDDSFSVTGNVTFVQDAAGGLLTNDFDPDGPGTPVFGTDLLINAPSVSKVSGTTTGDGTLTVAADGSFDYTPPAGETGNEQWQYTVSDGDGLDSNEVGIIDFSINNFVWFVDNSVIGPGSGTQADPFNDFSSLNGSGGSGDVDSDGDIIFVFEGAGNYGSLELENNQQLIGEEAGLSLAGIAPGGRPTLTTTSNAIDLAQNNTITGLDVATTNSGIGIFGSTVGNLTISDVSISGTGQAVDIDNGTLDVTFDSVSSSGTSVGIDLSNTTGSFTVAGDGSATQGGNASGGTIDAVDIGVNLNNVAGVSLNNMLINGGHNDFAIRGTGVNGFTFDNSTISGTSGDNPGADEGAIKFTNLTGSASITQSVVSGGIKNNLEIDNSTGTLDRLVIDRAEFTGHTGNDQDDGVTIEAAGSSVVNVTVIGSTFTAHKGDHFNYNMTGDSTGDLVFGTAASGNTLVGGHPSVLGGGITITGSGTGATPDLTFDIRNNDINGAVLQAINVNVLQNGTATDQADWSGTIDNNRIGTAGVFHSGSSTGNGLEVTANDKANMTVAITNNQIREFAQTGMRVLAGDATSGFGGGTTNATITGNQISKTVPQTPNDFVFGGISVESGSSSTAPDDHVMNVHVAGNNITIDDGGTFQFFPTFGIQVFERFSTVMELTQGGSGSTDSEQVLLDNNTITCPFCTNQTDDVEGPLDVDVVTTFPATPLVAAPAPSGDQLSVIGDQNDESAIHNPQSAIVSDDGILSSAELDFIVEAAKVRWTATGLSAEQSAAIDSVDFTVADMPGWYLGSFDGQTVRIDADAAGWGWYVDATPLDDSEFVRPARQAGRGTNDGEGPARQAGPTGMDLLTAVMHEMGHIVGLNHNSDASDVMTASLTAGVRRIPAAGQADGATPFSTGHTEYIGAPIAIGTLPAGKSVTVTFDITVNAGVGSGTIISNQGNVTADGGIDVDTDDPAQGGAADPTTTTVGGGAAAPDLTGQTFDVNPSGSDTVNAGDTIEVDANVINNGTAAAGASSADVYLSTDANIDPATDLLILGGVGIAGLNPGLSGGFNNGSVSLPAQGDAFWQGDGTYFVGVVWDIDNDVTESNEGNNRNQGLGIDIDDITVNNTTLPPATIGNFVWDDTDADGIQDGGEPGIVGATVNLRNAADTMQLDTTTTGVGGIYSFTVTPGAYIVEFVAPGGFSFSPQGQGGDNTLDSDANPATGKTVPITVASGENNDTVDAGLNTAPPVASDVQIIDDGDLARFSAGGFTRLQSVRNPHGYVGDDGIMEEHYSQANSGNIATWTFTVTPGVYRVSANWVPHPNRATNSPFRVFDGPASGTPVAGRDINQQPAPDDFTDAGAPWEDIASQVAITGTTLTVSLADFPTNGFVIADAIRIERDLQPEIELTDLTTGNPIADGGTVAMGSVLMDVPTSRNIRISNLGSGDLNVSDVSLNNTMGSAFSLMPDPDPVGGTGTIAFGGSADFTIALDTSVNGVFSATVTVNSNDADEGTFTFDVTATVDTKLFVDDGDLLRFDAGGFTRLQSIRNPHGFVGDDGIMEEHYSEQNDGNSATWTFTVTPGMYRVSANWVEHANRATNSPFSVFDGPATGTPVATATLNQRLAPDDFSDGGVFWEDIAVPVQINGTQLTVGLGDTPTNGFVIADAIRIERLPMLRAGEVVASGEAAIRDQRQVASSPIVAGIIDSSAVDVLFDAAVAEWSRIDAAAAHRLANVTVEVRDLPADVLGLASQFTSQIWLDVNAAGYGWDLGQESRVESQESEGSISFTPSPHHPITPSSFDLLTVVTHELGHVLGLPDLDPLDHPQDVMAGRFGTGVRRSPFAAEVNYRNAIEMQPNGWLADRLFVNWNDLIGQVTLDIYPKSMIGGNAGPAQEPKHDYEFTLVEVFTRRELDTNEIAFASARDPEPFDRDEASVDALFAEIGDGPESDSESD